MITSCRLSALSLSFSVFCDFDADRLERKKQLFIFTLISLHLVVLDDPVFPLQRASRFRFILLFVSPCWLFCVSAETDEAQSFTWNTLLMFWLSSFLSFFVLVLSGCPLGLPGDR